MSWWEKMTAWLRGDRPRTSTPARWLDAAHNPFGVPVLDLLSITGTYLSGSTSSDEAEMSMSWGRKTVADLDADISPAVSLECDLRYPAEKDLPDGWLFIPSTMEQKWVIGYRGSRILLARSWTGKTIAVADTRHEDTVLTVQCLHLADQYLSTFGAPTQAFDWVLRSHALGQLLPLPVAGSAALLLQEVPLAVFSHHGHVAAYAATSWSPPPPDRALRATSALVTAVLMKHPQKIAELAAIGHSLNARAAINGYTALHVAAARGDLPLVRQLLDLGADPNILSDLDMPVFLTALVNKGSVELLELLAAYGADVAAVNRDGFGALHTVAEVDHPAPLTWLLSKGLNLEQLTRHGHTPLHIAAALGHIKALKALLEAGANLSAKSTDGATAHDIARAQGKSESIKVLDTFTSRKH